MGLIARRDESSNKNTAPVGRKENEINWGGGGGWRGLDLFDDRYKGTYIKQKNRCFINNCTTIEFLISDNFPSLFLYMKKSS